ncbi:hypothetical protein ACFL35_20315 [Candidatus Riflebacteria bacterium]
MDGKEKKITVDEEYLKESITRPDAKVVKGYSPDLKAIIACLKTLN